MNIIDASQGSQEWLAIRANHFTASEAPAMMGASKYQTRAELLRQKHTGIAADVDANTQRLFDRGHAAEAAARPIVEGIIGAELFPATGALEVDGLPLLASFDGVTMLEDRCWESKLWNAGLADQVRAGHLEPHYYWQLEQQLLVAGAERVYFTTSDGTPENTVGMWYEAVPGRREKLIAGWKQFAEDLKNYQHIEIAEKPQPQVSIELPALFVQAKGSITDSNMVAYGEALNTMLAEVRAIKLVTDQDFSNAKAAAAMFREQYKKLELAKEAMLAQTVSIGEAARMIDAWREDLRLTALQLEKDVEKEDAAKKAAIVNDGRLKYEAYIKALNARLGGQYMPYSAVDPRWGAAIKGKRNYASMHDAVNDALANAKAEADIIADRIEANRKMLTRGDAGGRDWIDLFPDFAHVCTKSAEDFHNLVTARVSQDVQRQEAERERIRQEEAAKLAAEHERAEAQRLAHEAESQANEQAAMTQAHESPAVQERTVTPIQAPESSSGATVKLGEIGARLGFNVTADFLSGLGHNPVSVERNSKLYREAEFTRICQDISAHVLQVARKSLREAA